MNEILYTFIIPHRNSPSLLERCIKSIPYRDDIQIIVIDDNSKEELKPTIRRNDLTVKLLNKSDAKRAGHARNVGISLAQGKWLLFADADDYYCDDLFDILDNYKDSKFDVIYFNYYRIEKNSLKFTNGIIDNFCGDSLELDEIKYRTNAPWNKMVRLQYLIKNNIKFEESINGNDMFFTYQIGYLAKEVDVNKTPIYFYDTSSDGMTNKKSNPEEYYLCRLKHWYQAREFYRFVGHPEWGENMLIRFLSVLYKKGLCQFVKCIKVFFCNFKEILDSKSFFVDNIVTRKN